MMAGRRRSPPYIFCELPLWRVGEAYHMPLAPHCTNTLLGLSASMHAIAAVPLFLIHETNLNATPKGLVRADSKDHRLRRQRAAFQGMR